MKKLFCLFTAIITIMSFAACGNDDIESGSMGQEISKTEISRQNEQSFEDESSFAEVSEPVSEEISEPVSEEVSRKDPEQHIDPEDFPYRRWRCGSQSAGAARWPIPWSPHSLWSAPATRSAPR